MSKKLTVALLAQLIGGLLLALNTKLGLNLPAEVQATVAGSMGLVAFWYLQKQGVIDKEKEKTNA